MHIRTALFRNAWWILILLYYPVYPVSVLFNSIKNVFNNKSRLSVNSKLPQDRIFWICWPISVFIYGLIYFEFATPVVEWLKLNDVIDLVISVFPSPMWLSLVHCGCDFTHLLHLVSWLTCCRSARHPPYKNPGLPRCHHQTSSFRDCPLTCELFFVLIILLPNIYSQKNICFERWLKVG